MSVIHSRAVARRLTRKRAGLSSLDRRRPSAERISGLQDTELRRTVLTPATTRHGIHDPTHGYATRVPPRKNAKTARGFIFFNGVKVYHESELEHRVSLRIAVRNDVKSLHSQFPKLHYIDADGVLREHVADFYVEYQDGLREAVLVKLEKKRKKMKELVERIQVHENPRVVDGIQVLTEKYGTHDAAENANMVRWFRHYHHQPDVEELLDVLRKVPGWIRFGTLLMNCKSVPRRRAAVWRLIDLGVLFSPTGEKITDLTWLGFAPEGGPTGLLG